MLKIINFHDWVAKNNFRDVAKHLQDTTDYLRYRHSEHFIHIALIFNNLEIAKDVYLRLDPNNKRRLEEFLSKHNHFSNDYKKLIGFFNESKI